MNPAHILPPQYIPYLGASFATPFSVDHPISDNAAVLSPSQVRTLMDCSARWRYQYVLRLPRRDNANLALGTAVHTALTYNYRQKIDTRQDLDSAAVIEQFDRAWTAAADTTEWKDEDNPKQLAFTGQALIGLYMRETAPHVQPAAVEADLVGEINGVKVRSRADIIEENGTVRDFKTASSRTHGISNEQRFQLGTYVHLAKTSGLIAIDQMVKTKTPQCHTFTGEVTAADRAAVEILYPQAQQFARAGVVLPNRTSNMCKRTQCSFWRACQDEFGGKVSE
jgi:RecB family exonuclease